MPTPFLSRLLLVQTEPLPRVFVDALGGSGIRVEQASTPAALATALSRRLVDVVLADADFPGGLQAVCAAVTDRSPGVPLVVMASPASLGLAIEAVQARASDYVSKPPIFEEVLAAIQRAAALEAAAASRPPVPAPPGPGGRHVIGDSGAMRALWALVGRAAPTNATVLIGGETGTGKEVVARRIHELSAARDGLFVKVPCGGLPDALLESELFGHEKGAFTGAAVRKPGRVELAEKGTLFLDEIGEVSPQTQVKLLRVLQDREYERLGGTETRRANVRFIAATHRDLPAMVASGQFREDLFYRLNVVRIVLPSLRQRREDIPALARHFVAETCRANGLAVEITPPAVAVLAAQKWPGNVRQLQNLIERLVVLADSVAITPDDVQRELGDVTGEVGAAAESAGASAGEPPEMSAIDMKGAVSKAERRQIEKALLKAKGNRDLAARLLGISRRTMYYKLRLYGME